MSTIKIPLNDYHLIEPIFKALQGKGFINIIKPGEEAEEEAPGEEAEEEAPGEEEEEEAAEGEEVTAEGEEVGIEEPGVKHAKKQLAEAYVAYIERAAEDAAKDAAKDTTKDTAKDTAKIFDEIKKNIIF